MSDLDTVKAEVKIPVAVKLSPFFSSLAHFGKMLEGAGADAVVLFNRFYQPDFDTEALEVEPSLHLSDSSELLLRLRWLALLSAQLDVPLAVSGGVHTAEDAIKFWIKTAKEDGQEIPQPRGRLVYA